MQRKIIRHKGDRENGVKWKGSEIPRTFGGKWGATSRYIKGNDVYYASTASWLVCQGFMTAYLARVQHHNWSSIIIVTSLTLGADMIDGKLLMTLGWNCYYNKSDKKYFKKVLFAIGHYLKRRQSFIKLLLLKWEEDTWKNKQTFIICPTWLWSLFFFFFCILWNINAIRKCALCCTNFFKSMHNVQYKCLVACMHVIWYVSVGTDFMHTAVAPMLHLIFFFFPTKVTVIHFKTQSKKSLNQTL